MNFVKSGRYVAPFEWLLNFSGIPTLSLTSLSISIGKVTFSPSAILNYMPRNLTIKTACLASLIVSGVIRSLCRLMRLVPKKEEPVE